MERKIARFNERIVIQKNTVVTDKYGNHKNVWTDFYSCFAYASTYQYDKENEAANSFDAIYYLIEKNIKVSKSVLNVIVSAFITAHSVNGADNAILIEFLIRVKKLSRSDCDTVVAWVEKYDKLTQICPSDFDDEVWGKKLEARRLIAILMHSLKLYYENQKLTVPDGVVYWENVINDDEEFVEIRRTWE